MSSAPARMGVRFAIKNSFCDTWPIKRFGSTQWASEGGESRAPSVCQLLEVSQKYGFKTLES